MATVAWPQNYGKAHPVSAKAYGRKIADWSNTSTGNAGTAAVAAEDLTDDASATLTLTHNATPSYYQVNSASALVLAEAPTTVGIWVKASGIAAPRHFELRFYNGAANRIIAWNFACEPSQDWQFLISDSQRTASNTFSYGTDAISVIRVTEQGAVGGGWDAWGAGENIKFGNVYINPRTRPKFLLMVDDGYSALTVNGVGYPTGYPASGGNYLDICAAYGFVGTASIIPAQVGQSGRVTVTTIAQLAAAGWSINSHSDGNDLGATPGGGVSGIRAQVQADIDAIAAMGYADTAGHYTLPGGTWTEEIKNAVLGVRGLKSVRSVSTYNFACPALPIGRIAGGGFSQGGNYRGTGWIALPGSMQIDGAHTLANVVSYVDYIIKAGGTGTCYTHSIDATIATKFDGLCAYLRTKARQGLIDVVNIEQWYRGLTQPALVSL